MAEMKLEDEDEGHDGDDPNGTDAFAPLAEKPRPYFYLASSAKVGLFALLGGWFYAGYWMYRCWVGYRAAWGYSQEPFWRSVYDATGYRISPFWRAPTKGSRPPYRDRLRSRRSRPERHASSSSIGGSLASVMRRRLAEATKLRPLHHLQIYNLPKKLPYNPDHSL